MLHGECTKLSASNAEIVDPQRWPKLHPSIPIKYPIRFRVPKNLNWNAKNSPHCVRQVPLGILWAHHVMNNVPKLHNGVIVVLGKTRVTEVSHDSDAVILQLPSVWYNVMFIVKCLKPECVEFQKNRIGHELAYLAANDGCQLVIDLLKKGALCTLKRLYGLRILIFRVIIVIIVIIRNINIHGMSHGTSHTFNVQDRDPVQRRSCRPIVFGIFGKLCLNLKPSTVSESSRGNFLKRLLLHSESDGTASVLLDMKATFDDQLKSPPLNITTGTSITSHGDWCKEWARKGRITC